MGDRKRVQAEPQAIYNLGVLPGRAQAACVQVPVVVLGVRRVSIEVHRQVKLCPPEHASPLLFLKLRTVLTMFVPL